MDDLELVAGRARELLREGAAVGARIAERTGGPSTDRRALQLLDALSGEVLTPGRLAEELGLSPAATTALVDRLAAAGLVERVRDLPDRRQVRLRISSQARQLGAELLLPWAQRIDRAAARLTLEQAAVVAGFLGEVLHGPQDDEAAITTSS